MRNLGKLLHNCCVWTQNFKSKYRFLQLVFATQPITNVLLEKRKKMVKELKRCSLHHVAAVPECNAVFIFIQFVPSLTYTLLHSTTIIRWSRVQSTLVPARGQDDHLWQANTHGRSVSHGPT